MPNQDIQRLNLSELHLDKKNPRLPSGFRSEDTLREDIVNWMLKDASIIELMLAIGQAGFFIGEALLVVKENNEYVVIEGNRRLTSLILLSEPNIASIHKNKIQKVISETKHRPIEIPCIVFDSRSEINKYLGYRHVTGVKSWGVLQKSKYLAGLQEEYIELPFSEQCRELAKAIGSRSDHVRKLLVAYQIYEVIEDNNFFNIRELDESTIYFNYYADSLSREYIRNFIGVDIKSEKPIEKLNETNLKELTEWFFVRNTQNKTRVLGDSMHLGMLDKVLANEDAKQYFRMGSGSISDAYQMVSVTKESFNQEIDMALMGLKRAQSIIHRLDGYSNSDTLKEKLKEIFHLAKNMNAIIIAAEETGWDD